MPGYKTWATNDIPTAADMNELHADPLQADVATDETKSAASYGDLTTVGPSVTKTLVTGQKVLVYVRFYGLTAVDGAHGYMSFAVSGASTLAATDANAAHYFAVKIGTNTAAQVGSWAVFTATAGGSHTFTSKYRGDGTNLMHFLDRRLLVKSF